MDLEEKSDDIRKEENKKVEYEASIALFIKKKAIVLKKFAIRISKFIYDVSKKFVSLLRVIFKSGITTNVLLFAILCTLIISSVNICDVIKRYSSDWDYSYLRQIIDSIESLNSTMEDVRFNTYKIRFW